MVCVLDHAPMHMNGMVSMCPLALLMNWNNSFLAVSGSGSEKYYSLIFPVKSYPQYNGVHPWGATSQP